jgi:hypothetical protein
MIENVIAATVVSLTLVVVVALAPRATKAAAHIEIRAQAHKLAQTVIEKHRPLTAAQLAPQASAVQTAYALDFQNVQLVPELEIVRVKPLTRELKVKVVWDEGGTRREILHSAVVTELKR